MTLKVSGAAIIQKTGPEILRDTESTHPLQATKTDKVLAKEWLLLSFSLVQGAREQAGQVHLHSSQACGTIAHPAISIYAAQGRPGGEEGEGLGAWGRFCFLKTEFAVPLCSAPPGTFPG